MNARDIPIISDVNGLLDAFEEFMRRKPVKMRNAYWRAFQAAWQSSRDGLVIELPADAHLSRDGLDEHYLAGDMRDQIVESIHTAGVKTK